MNYHEFCWIFTNSRLFVEVCSGSKTVASFADWGSNRRSLFFTRCSIFPPPVATFSTTTSRSLSLPPQFSPSLFILSHSTPSPTFPPPPPDWKAEASPLIPHPFFLRLRVCELCRASWLRTRPPPLRPLLSRSALLQTPRPAPRSPLPRLPRRKKLRRPMGPTRSPLVSHSQLIPSAPPLVDNPDRV